MEQHVSIYYTLMKHFLLQSACTIYSSCEKWFTDCTHLLHVCDDISHLQSELIILLFFIVKPNNCFSCVCVCVFVCVFVRVFVRACVCVWREEGVGGMGRGKGTLV